MSEKFKNVPNDPDTNVILQKVANIDEYEVLYQAWVWEGIKAESVIFVSDDIKQLSDAQLEEMMRELPLLEEQTKITIKRSDSGYTFVNFNFKTLD